MNPWLSVNCWWDPRPEDSGTLARRLAGLFTSLAAIDPIFAHWTRGGMRHRSVVPRDFAATPDIAELRDWLDENRDFESCDGRKAFAGYRIFADTVPRPGEPKVGFRLRSIAAKRQGFLYGEAFLTVYYSAPVPQLQLRSAGRPMLLALAQAWDAMWGGVETDDYCVTGGPPRRRLIPPYTGGWMVYLKAEKAQQVKIPDDVQTETLPEGNLFLTATEAIFDRRDALHRAAAARIQMALDPLNG